MANFKPLANRHNVVKPSNGNSPVRFRDSTATVASVITGGNGTPVRAKRGCGSCGR